MQWRITVTCLERTAADRPGRSRQRRAASSTGRGYVALRERQHLASRARSPASSPPGIRTLDRGVGPPVLLHGRADELSGRRLAPDSPRRYKSMPPRFVASAYACVALATLAPAREKNDQERNENPREVYQQGSLKIPGCWANIRLDQEAQLRAGIALAFLRQSTGQGKKEEGYSHQPYQPGMISHVENLRNGAERPRFNEPEGIREQRPQAWERGPVLGNHPEDTKTPHKTEASPGAKNLGSKRLPAATFPREDIRNRQPDTQRGHRDALRQHIHQRAKASLEKCHVDVGAREACNQGHGANYHRGAKWRR